MKVGGKVLQMRDRVAVRDSSSVHSAVIPTWSPVSQAYFGTMWRGEAHGLEEGRMMPKSSMCSNSCLVACRGFWWEPARSGLHRGTSGSDVVDHLMLH